jgi:gluconate kinase
VLEHRLEERKNHYMSPALLDSQIATLEIPRDAIRVAGDLPPDQVVGEIVSAIRGDAVHGATAPSAESHP